MSKRSQRPWRLEVRESDDHGPEEWLYSGMFKSATNALRTIYELPLVTCAVPMSIRCRKQTVVYRVSNKETGEVIKLLTLEREDDGPCKVEEHWVSNDTFSDDKNSILAMREVINSVDWNEICGGQHEQSNIMR